MPPWYTLAARDGPTRYFEGQCRALAHHRLALPIHIMRSKRVNERPQSNCAGWVPYHAFRSFGEQLRQFQILAIESIPYRQSRSMRDYSQRPSGYGSAPTAPRACAPPSRTFAVVVVCPIWLPSMSCVIREKALQAVAQANLEAGHSWGHALTLLAPQPHPLALKANLRAARFMFQEMLSLQRSIRTRNCLNHAHTLVERMPDGLTLPK